MAITGLHLTRIGNGNFLLEPLRSLNIGEPGQMMQDIVTLLQQGHDVLHHLPRLANIQTA